MANASLFALECGGELANFRERATLPTYEHDFIALCVI